MATKTTQAAMPFAVDPARVGRWVTCEPYVFGHENELGLHLTFEDGGPLTDLLVRMRDEQADRVVMAIRSAQLSLAVRRAQLRETFRAEIEAADPTTPGEEG